MTIRDRLPRLTLALLVLITPACIYEGMRRLLPWNVAAGSLVDKPEPTTEQPKPKDDDRDDDWHACCDDMENTRMIDICDADGKDNVNGDYLCCHFCRKVCGKRTVPRQSKNPTPVPIPRACPAAVHCQRVKKCPIGEAGDCCAGKDEDKGCGQPCPPWSGGE